MIYIKIYVIMLKRSGLMENNVKIVNIIIVWYFNLNFRINFIFENIYQSRIYSLRGNVFLWQTRFDVKKFP